MGVEEQKEMRNNGADEPFCRAGTETRKYRMALWAQWGGKGGTNREPRCRVLFTVSETAGRKLLYRQGAQPSAFW